MALMKSKGEREIALIEQLEQQIARREKRQRYLRIAAGAVALLGMAAIATGHALCGSHKESRHRR